MNRMVFIAIGIIGGGMLLLASRQSKADMFVDYGETITPWPPDVSPLSSNTYTSRADEYAAMFSDYPGAPDPWAEYDAELSQDYALDFDQGYPIYKPQTYQEPIYPEFAETTYEDTRIMRDENLNAFLAMIRTFEAGTAGDRSYSTLIGGGQFSDFSEHPFILDPYMLAIQSGNLPASKAAGAYQFLPQTWTEARDALGLPDFSPASQDAAAVFLIKRRGALADVEAGNFSSAIIKLGKEWASLPGSPYGQTSKTLAQAESVYVNFGGTVA